MKGIESLERGYCTTAGLGEPGTEAGISNTDDGNETLFGKVLIRPKDVKLLTAEVVSVGRRVADGLTDGNVRFRSQVNGDKTREKPILV